MQNLEKKGLKVRHNVKLNGELEFFVTLQDELGGCDVQQVQKSLEDKMANFSIKGERGNSKVLVPLDADGNIIYSSTEFLDVAKKNPRYDYCSPSIRKFAIILTQDNAKELLTLNEDQINLLRMRAKTDTEFLPPRVPAPAHAAAPPADTHAPAPAHAPAPPAPAPAPAVGGVVDPEKQQENLVTIKKNCGTEDVIPIEGGENFFIRFNSRSKAENCSRNLKTNFNIKEAFYHGRKFINFSYRGNASIIGEHKHSNSDEDVEFFGIILTPDDINLFQIEVAPAPPARTTTAPRAEAPRADAPPADAHAPAPRADAHAPAPRATPPPARTAPAPAHAADLPPPAPAPPPPAHAPPAHAHAPPARAPAPAPAHAPRAAAPAPRAPAPAAAPPADAPNQGEILKQKIIGGAVLGAVGFGGVLLCASALGIGIVSAPVIGTAIGVGAVGIVVGVVVSDPIASAISNCFNKNETNSL